MSRLSTLIAGMGVERCPMQAKEGEEQAQSRCKDAKLSAASLFEADPEIDFDQPSVQDFLKAEGLEAMFA